MVIVLYLLISIHFYFKLFYTGDLMDYFNFPSLILLRPFTNLPSISSFINIHLHLHNISHLILLIYFQFNVFTKVHLIFISIF
jgi:hypothetical protein